MYAVALMGSDRQATQTLTGRTLDLVRRVRGYSVAELAKRVGVSERTVARWITGETGMRGHDAVRLADALAVDLRLLLEPPEDEDDVLLRIVLYDRGGAVDLPGRRAPD